MLAVAEMIDNGIGTEYSLADAMETFTGREWDGDTGLYFYRARYYSPEMSRFISEDPIGLAGGINMYSYANNNPVLYGDPLGLYTLSDVPKAYAHYCDQTQTPWSTSFSSINWGNTNSEIGKKIEKMVGGVCVSTTIPVNFDFPASTQGADASIIGRHTVRVTGTIAIKCDCSWSFTGTMASASGYDTYNFNPSNRGLKGEALVWAGRNICSNGKSFVINIQGLNS